MRAAARLANEAHARREELAVLRRTRNERGLPTRPLASILKPLSNRALTIAFFPGWHPASDNAYPALMHALPKLDWLMPTWLALQGPGLDFKNTLDARLLAELRSKRPNLAIVPVLQNSTLGEMGWAGPGEASRRSRRAATRCCRRSSRSSAPTSCKA